MLFLFVLTPCEESWKYTNVRIPCAAHLGFEAQGYESFSESMRNDESRSDFMMSWLLS